MRANLPGVGAGPALRGKVDLCTARWGYWIDKENNWEIYFDKLNSTYESRSIFIDERMFAFDFENYCRCGDGSNSVWKEFICKSALTLGLK